MLLTISTTHSPATDLGFLLHKHPEKLQSFDVAFGQAHVFYPEASPERCTVCLLLEIDSVGLVRRQYSRSRDSFSLAEYVNDRPYVASSFMSVAIAKVFGTALSGKCKDRPELVKTAIPLTVKLPSLPCRGGERFLRKLFEPLGYQVDAHRYGLDSQFPEWGKSRYYSVKLEKTCRLSKLLSHLYVLIPVLDDEKHYWVADAEIEKLLKHGEGWLSEHPEQEQIVSRYLKHQRKLTQHVLSHFGDTGEEEIDVIQEEEKIEKRIGLNELRLTKTVEVMKESGAKRVLDLGCGEGKLLRKLMADKQFEEIVGMDVSHQTLKIAQQRLRLDRLPDRQKERIKLMQGSLCYRDDRLQGYDAAAVIEVIEHLDITRLSSFERVLFEYARPQIVVLTTPNIEYNVKFENLPVGRFRHRDHRFEWTREEFETWGSKVCDRFGYSAKFYPIGETEENIGAPTQMAVFTRISEH
ncbi:3' terminal RNA ribose 2'-O-methyltransferase Hen1 [Candidatus Poribacteria bacterium]|nr:3' terminal RNA ribose 2'-O-methyltransferase Hen1 [Candidatus Poribacteria bacterium]MYB63198.1 3' terminal RNA ribose 2'-O-methyltransferase Hen1 [Candidatus Poribacteria bacterium]MYF56801.1 3' terminal RNA ribose 2'-O-methyltransferase Hen1 [Candidatus Poribacteria bacterium]MYI94468.1 3' terminal RNA ribose 2'-O-methyltransferase Hen1 [Candidatus Poribacteria bacterium]